MRKTNFLLGIVIALMINLTSVRGQLAITAMGAGHYPGMAASQLNNDRFDAGGGYGFGLRHDLISIHEKVDFHLRYTAKFYFNQIEIRRSTPLDFKFNYFTADILTTFYGSESWQHFAGLGLSLMSADGNNKYAEYSDQRILPSVLLGSEYALSTYYAMFTELHFQYGEIDVYPEKIPVHGVSVLVGFYMYLSDK